MDSNPMKNEALLVPVQSPTVNPYVEFRDGQYMFCETNMGGGLEEKFVSDAAVREAFSKIPVDTGWFNHEAAGPAVCRWGDGKRGEWAVLYVPPACHALEITNDGSGQPYAVERVTAPLPALAFIGAGTHYFAFAMKTPRLDPHQELYRCPLPNVMQDGSVCWGLLRQPRADPRTIFDAWRLFATSTFNNHMANAKSKAQRADVRVRLKEMARAPQPVVYPGEDLMRQSEDGSTLDGAIRGYFETGAMPG
jgi:hypothetical protein